MVAGPHRGAAVLPAVRRGGLRDGIGEARLACADVTIAPYGSWPTPFTSASVVAGAVRLGELVLDGDDVLWAEGGPPRAAAPSSCAAAPTAPAPTCCPTGGTPAPPSTSTAAARWWARDGVVGSPTGPTSACTGSRPAPSREPLTPEPRRRAGDRFADGDVAPDGASIVCVRERHHGRGRERVNEIVRLDAPAARRARGAGQPGPDFVAAPRSVARRRRAGLAALGPPGMPWDAHRARRPRRRQRRRTRSSPAAPEESILQPRVAPGRRRCGSLSDRTGWWNLYRWTPGDGVEPVVAHRRRDRRAALGVRPARYAVLDRRPVVFARRRATATTASPSSARRHGRRELDMPFTAIDGAARRRDGTVLVVAGSPDQRGRRASASIADGGAHRDAARRRATSGVDPAFISVPEPIDVPDRPAAAPPTRSSTRPRNPERRRARRASGRR